MSHGDRPAVEAQYSTDPSGRIATEFSNDAPAVGSWAFLYGLVAFCPLPALPLGRTSALQMGDVAAVISIAMMLMLKCFPGRHVLTWLALIVPAFISIIGASNSLFADPLLSLKGLLVWCLATMHVIVAGFLMIRSTRRLLLGASIAIIIHFGVGLIQYLSFLQNEFPFLWIYQTNPVYRFDKVLAAAYALYMKRPFGLFPEPSAMAASIGPWIFFSSAITLGLVWRKTLLSRTERIVHLFSATMGTGLILMSQSRHAFFLVAGMLVLAVAWIFQQTESASTPLRRFLVAAVLLGCFVVAGESLIGQRFSRANPLDYTMSDERGSSMLAATKTFVEGSTPVQLCAGFGIGQSATIMQKTKGWDAVWSMLLTNVLETGLLGAASWSIILFFLFQTMFRSQFKIVGLGMLMIWLVGIGVTTSYSDLAPNWICLGCFLSWEQSMVRPTINPPERVP